jgi:manganese transport protein
MRTVESIVIALIVTIASCFLVEIFWARPEWIPMAKGLIPRIDRRTLFDAVAIVGATVMPHNLFLHSALVQTRRIGKSVAEMRDACRFNLIDSVVALNGAMLVNIAILVLSAAVFFRAGKIVTEIEQAYQLLTPLLGATFASILFGVALLCSGQSSTITGTLAGQIVMEGFLDIRVRPWLRRLLTRSLAVIPAAFVVYYQGAQPAEPGGPQRAALLRHHSPHPLHQRPSPDGSLRKRSMAALDKLGLSRSHRGFERLAHGRPVE